ncbi:PTS sugar transporter subunit IIB [Tetragenococcus halophilus]|uniref:Phosphotransferase system enzyme IIB component n=1 Tax=Tetragenococcus halophilus (strain DSM 20338 / JCM 20259 / NCIMB 9735 / NBRC 12172) TaxID=945021 RepID=A0AAN1VRT3_TETHN|nr:PTS sugar transporter subunit IIB [Tetragenococcus halophilus]MDN6146519.1 PTS sugar transporter subunit IIB [Tetragenococcus koreensis]MDN6640751.1 PTS sugar transporter subunit IIB [Tetragenococcus sp.]GBD62118.1 putative phosphotransferase system enzyme IIB component [Tetragenococcus halophilus subsp. halophilus]MCF1602647.1 PTS sugar transporter subunit IIB [Tetragenococcus halophilus]MCO8287447.1 PTS sugar transporter subunit IIB [Tetragenococcus halophilus]
MVKKVEILFVCGAGLGSSFAAQMSAEDVLNKHNVNAKLDHVDISTAASSKADVIITAQNFESQFKKFSIDDKTSIIYLKNIVSKKEIEEKLIPVLQEKEFVEK